MSEHIEVKESLDDKKESQRILNINAIGKIANMRDLADKAIEDGTPSEVFQARVFTHMQGQVSPVSTSLDLSRQEAKQYSIVRAFYKDRSGAGFEREVSKDLAAQHLAALIYWETHDQFLLGGSGIWGGTVFSTLISDSDFGIDFNQFINYTGAAYALGAIKTMDHGTWNYVPQTAVPEPSTAILLGAGLLGISFLSRKKKKSRKQASYQ